MALFNFIENLHHLSLGITFIFIATTLVFIILSFLNLKKYVASLEQKCDTMFDIVQNISKEVVVNKANNNYILSIMNSNINPNNQGSLSNNKNVELVFDKQNTDYENDDEEEEEDEEDDVDEHDDDEDEEKDEDDIDEHDDNEDDEEDDDEDDDEDDEDDDEDDDEQLIIGGIERITFEKITIPEEDDIKIIKVENSFDLDLDNTKDTIIIESDIQIEKIEEIQNTNNESKIEKVSENNIQEEVQDISSSTNHENNIEAYKKMSITALRTLVISKGLSTDPSKMKKPELLKLLSELSEE